MHHCETEHYIFHYANGSKAQQDIEHIAAVQEASYHHITTMLGLSMNEKIHYYFYDSREGVGRECERRFGEYTPYNGCAVSNNEILAVYSDDTQCIGAHEDTHIIMSALGFPESSFLEEGVACAMGGTWWGLDNHVWSAFYRKEKLCPSVTELLQLSFEAFYLLDDCIVYPLAGSYVSYLLMRFGKDRFCRFYLEENYSTAAQHILGCTLEALEKDFFQYIDLLKYDEALYCRIAELRNKSLADRSQL